MEKERETPKIDGKMRCKKGGKCKKEKNM